MDSHITYPLVECEMDFITIFPGVHPPHSRSIWWTESRETHENFIARTWSMQLQHIDGLVQERRDSIANALWPLLLTWFNFNPSMDK